MVLEKNVLKIYEELMDLRYRIGDNGSGEILEKDKFSLDYVLDFIEALGRAEKVVYDNNQGSKELNIGLIDYDFEKEDAVIRVYD